MNIAICGIAGFMGNEVLKLGAKNYRGAEVICGIDQVAGKAKAGDKEVNIYTSFDALEASEDNDRVEMVIDFSHHSLTKALTDYAVKNNKKLIIATTGQTGDELALIKEAAQKVPVFHAANYSLGIALLIELAKKTAASMPDAEIEIIEKHHDRKLDAPSGTALAIADAIKEVRPSAVNKPGRAGNGKRSFDEIGIHAIRMGNIVGEHEVMIGTQNQTITLKHEAHSRALFAEGAFAAADFIKDKAPGMYSMKDLV